MQLKFNKYGDIRARIHLLFHENKAVWVSAYLWAPKMGGTHSFRKSGSLGHAGRRTYCHLEVAQKIYFLSVRNLLIRIQKIERDFHTDKPSQRWLTDITEFALPAGNVYLAAFLDCFNSLLSSWAISTILNYLQM